MLLAVRIIMRAPKCPSWEESQVKQGKEKAGKEGGREEGRKGGREDRKE